jgi:hypothetical protein
MTAMFRAAAPCAFLATLVAGPLARAQMQPPPFDSAPAPAAPVPSPRPAAPVPPAFVDGPPRRAAPPQAQSRQQPSDDDIDDPKVFRRLGTRISVPPPKPSAPPDVPAPVARPAVAKASPPAAVPAPPPVDAAQPAPSPAPEMEGAGVPAIERPYTPVAEAPFEPTLPRLKLGLRRFQFVRIGASSSPDGVAEPETFNNFSVDVYPVSRTIRIGLTSAFGWQSGTWLANGDYFATQTVSLGAQYREFGRIVPFAEGYAGVGYMRRLQFDRTIPTAFWQFGADVGAEVYVARVGYLSFAVGYMRPVNGFAKRQQFTSVFVDTWSFKIGIGI